MGFLEYVDEVLADSPAHFWPGDGDYEDIAGGVDATPGPTAPALLAQGGPDFDHGLIAYSGQYTNHSTLPTWSSLLSSPNSWTVEFLYVGLRSVGAGSYICGVVNDGTNTIFRIGCWINNAGSGSGPNPLHLQVRTNSGGNSNWATDVNINDGLWHHVAIVVADIASSVQFYVDGEPVTTTRVLATGTSSNPIGAFQYPLVFGADNVRGTVSGYGIGGIAGLAFYNSGLSAGRVAAHWDALSPTPNIDEVVLGPGFWSWWTRPRAVYFNGHTYIGGVAPNGAIFIDRVDEESNVARTTLATLEGDDHNNPAFILVPGKPPVAIYSRHTADAALRYRVGTTDIEDGFTFASESVHNPGGNTGYATAYYLGGDQIDVWSRIGSSSWGLSRTADWAQSWTTTVVFNFSTQFYMASRLEGDTLRCAFQSHPTWQNPPTRQAFYCEIDMTTGDITVPSTGGTVGNLDGTNLPLDVTTLDQVTSLPTGRRGWLTDVGPGRVVYTTSFDPSNFAATSSVDVITYDGSTWATTSLVAAGEPFDDTSTNMYVGGVQVGEDGRVWVAREANGLWRIERYDDEGVTLYDWFPFAVGHAVRVYPVEGGGPWEAVYGKVREPYSYNSFDARLVLAAEIPGPEETAGEASVALALSATARKASRGAGGVSLGLGTGNDTEKAGATQANVSLTVAAEAAALARLVTSGALGLTVGIDGDAVKLAQASAALELAVEIHANADKAASVAGGLGLSLDVVGAAEGHIDGKVDGHLALALAVTATAAARRGASGLVALGLDVVGDASAVTQPTAAGALGLSLSAAGHAAKSASAVATLDLVLAIAARARDDGFVLPPPSRIVTVAARDRTVLAPAHPRIVVKEP